MITYSIEEVKHQKKNLIKSLAHYHKGVQVFVFITLCSLISFLGKLLFTVHCEWVALVQNNKPQLEIEYST